MRKTSLTRTVVGAGFSLRKAMRRLKPAATSLREGDAPAKAGCYSSGECAALSAQPKGCGYKPADTSSSQWRKVCDLKVGDEIGVAKGEALRVNESGHALPYDDDSLNTAREIQIIERLLFQLWRPLFLSFPTVNYHANNQQRYAQGYKSYAQPAGKFFEKIAGKPNGQDSLAQIGYDLGYKFPGIFVNFYSHDFQLKLYCFINKLSRLILGWGQTLCPKGEGKI